MAAKKAPKKQVKKTYDYSGLKTGMRLQVESDGEYYAAEVVQVSTAAKRSKAPVKVSYKGYDGYDEWVGGDRLRSKALKIKTPEKTDAIGKEKEKLTLTYWPIFAKNIAPALALEFGGFDWEMGAGPGSKGTGDLWAEWLEMKWETTWGFLPNLMVGGKAIGSELAILQYLGRKKRVLAGLSDGDFRISQELLHQSEELYQKLTKNCPTAMAKDKDPKVYENFMTNADKNTHSDKQGLPVYLSQFEEFYTKCGGKDGKFTRSGKTVGELKLFATLQCVVYMKSDVLSECPNLKAFMQQLTEMPQVKSVLEGTAKNMKGPPTQYFIAPP